MAQPLGKLEKVDIRKIWQHEALSFTPWLAKPENLAFLYGYVYDVVSDLD